MIKFSEYGIRGRKVFEPPRYLTVIQAPEQILEAIDSRRKDGNSKKLKCKKQYAMLLTCIVHQLFYLSLSLSLPLPLRFDNRIWLCGCG